MRTLTRLILSGVLFAVSCSSLPPTAEELARQGREIAAKSSRGSVQVLFAYQRAMQLFTCKCEMVSLGGIAREMNMLASFSADGAPPQLPLTGGATFIPDSAELGSLSTSQLAKLRPLMVEALNKLGVEAYGVAAADLALGEAEIARLAAAATFPFVSLNVKSKGGKLKVVPFVDKTLNDQKFLITSFVPAGTKAADFEVSDPVAALRSLLAAPRPKGTIVVVLAEETKSGKRKMIAEIPGVNLWLGQSTADPDEVVEEQYDDSVLFVSAAGRGRSIARIRLERRAGAKTPLFTSPYFVDQARSLLALPAGEKPQGAFFDRVARIYESRRKATHRFVVDVLGVSREYEEPRNGLSPLSEMARQIASPIR